MLSIFSSGANINKSSVTYKQHIEKNIYLNSTEPISNLTFDDLTELSRHSEPTGALKEKLNVLLSKPYIVNRKYDSVLNKTYLRIAQWNIKRGFNADALRDILVNPDKYQSNHVLKIKKRDVTKLRDELNIFSTSDIICLNEIDIGMPRTKYKNIVSEIADPLNWNYAFATEFVEVGPILFKTKTGIDKDKYKGLHGNAVISRFPILSTKVIRLPDAYDWYKEEINKRQSPLEHIRKFGAKSIFSESIIPHELRHGGRQALVVDIKLPTSQVITVALTHLEDRAYPDERFKQFKYLLESLKDIKNPLVLAGDFNTSTTDTKPTNFKKEVYKRIRDPDFLMRQAAFLPVPLVPVVGGVTAVAFSKLLQYKDPFFPNIPIIFPNHERKFYTYLKEFRFNDGYSFDLSGDKKHSSNGKAGLLANSNQRHWKGFKSTFKFEKPRIIAYFKLDWFFIKPIVNVNVNVNGNGKEFLPFNGRTLKILNHSFPGHISDHNLLTVDLKI